MDDWKKGEGVHSLPFFFRNRSMRSSRAQKLTAILFLIILNLAIFWRVQSFDFVAYDDQVYVFNNVNVQAGLDCESVKWAFTTTDLGFWHPLTWLSLMGDHYFFALNPGGYHWTNILLHLAAGLFLFLALRRMTGSNWMSCFIAALFSIHPLHVESVAWVSERKDVLSGLFWMMTLWFYAYYAEKPVLVRYIPVLAAFVLGLMSKPMLVTLPFVLILLDFWPMRRLDSADSPGDSGPIGQDFKPLFAKRSFMFLICEKIPLVFLSVAASCLVFYTERKIGALAPLEAIPFADRLCNAIKAYLGYLVKTFCPTDLSVFYPYASQYNPWEVSFAAALLIWITILVGLAYKRAPYAIAGWFWFLGTLVPVIGLVQVGSHAMADRYTYIPLVGLFIVVTCAAFDLLGSMRGKRVILSLLGSIVLVVLAYLTYEQLQHWRNTEALFRKALSATGSGNYVAHNGLGNVMLNRGKVEEALLHFKEAVKARPNYEPAMNNAGIALVALKRKKEARDYFQAAIRIDPNFAMAYYNMGVILKDEGDFNQAEREFLKAIRIDPKEKDYYYWLAFVLLRQGRAYEARENYRTYLRLQRGEIQTAREVNNPEAKKIEDAMVNYYVGLGYGDSGDDDRAVDFYRRAIDIYPKFSFLHNNLGVVLTRKRLLADAEVAFKEAIRLDPNHAGARNNLGVIYFQKGMLDEAYGHFREAVRLRPDFANAHFYLAKIYRIKGMNGDASRHYRLANTLNNQYCEGAGDERPLWKMSIN